MHDKARQVRQAARDAVLLAGGAADRPAHPLLGSGKDCVLEGQSLVQTVLNPVRKMTSVAAVEEDPN